MTACRHCLRVRRDAAEPCKCRRRPAVAFPPARVVAHNVTRTSPWVHRALAGTLPVTERAYTYNVLVHETEATR